MDAVTYVCPPWASIFLATIGLRRTVQHSALESSLHVLPEAHFGRKSAKVAPGGTLDDSSDSESFRKCDSHKRGWSHGANA